MTTPTSPAVPEPSDSTKTSDLLVQCLEAEGVRRIFGVPGEENLDFLDSLSRSKIDFVLTRHEQAAGFMAATYGRLTGEIGVALSTLGPGATNLITAAAYAQLGGMPMLMITGQKPIKESKQALFQIIDVVDMMQPVTKFTAQVASGDRLPAQVREACRLALEERPGAVHLELPEDIAAEFASARPIPASDARPAQANEASLARAVELLRTAKTPVLVIGPGANRKETAAALLALVDLHGIPFVTTQMGKGVIDERHDLFLGNAALSADDFVHRALSHADVIVSVGHDIVEKPPFLMEPDQTRRVIHLDSSSAQVDPLYFPQVEVVGDIAGAVARISASLPPSKSYDLRRVRQAQRALTAHIESTKGDPRFPMLPERLVSDVREAMPDEGVIALDNGIYKLWFARNYPAHAPNTVLLDNALATMGAGLPSAIATKLVRPHVPVMAICGDGGFLMNSQELETAVRLEIDLIVVVLNDGALGMIEWKQEDMGFGPYGLRYGNPNLSRYAESYGAKGHRVGSADEFLPLARRCIEVGGVHLIDVPVDYSENHRALHERLPEETRQFGA